jgi:hypothetical protein
MPSLEEYRAWTDQNLHGRFCRRKRQAEPKNGAAGLNGEPAIRLGRLSGFTSGRRCSDLTYTVVPGFVTRHGGGW